MMARAVGALCLISLLTLLAGCGSGGVGLPGGGGDPAPAGDTVTFGSLEVGVESAAGFRTLTLETPVNKPVAFAAMYGSKIVRLQELGRGGKIAYMGHDGSDYEIYTINTDGSGPTNLTNNAVSDQEPAWSPDGSMIAFRNNDGGDYEIYTMNADGSGQAQLTDNSVDDTGPAWSPDGTQIAYASRDGDDDIIVMNADGSGQTPLTANSEDDRAPAWSPDGTKIAYKYYDFTNDHEIYVMNADGSGQTNLTDNALHDYDPAWSPDGSQIAYEGKDGIDYDVYLMNADGSGQTNLTGTSENGYDPAWSPDGSQIVYRSHDGSDNEITLMYPDGSGRTYLTRNSTHDYDPAWCPGPTVTRTLIGAAGTDGGFGPPLGESRPLALVGLRRGGLVSAATVKMHSAYWSSLEVEALGKLGSELTGAKLTGPEIKGILEDMGRGNPPLTWNVKATPATGAVLVFFDVTTGKITTVLASSDEPLDSSSSGRLTLRGEFTEAYSAADPTRNLITDTAAGIVLDGSGAVLSVH